MTQIIIGLWFACDEGGSPSHTDTRVETVETQTGIEPGDAAKMLERIDSVTRSADRPDLILVMNGDANPITHEWLADEDYNGFIPNLDHQ